MISWKILEEEDGVQATPGLTTQEENAKRLQKDTST